VAPHLDPEGFSAAVAAITSAFGDPSRRRIFLHVRASDGGVTAAEVAERFELHPNVARHHLDKRAAGGYVTVGPTRAATGAGRPSKRYVATGSGDDLELGVRHDDLVLRLLVRALALLPEDAAVAMAEEVGQEHGRALGAAMAAGEARRSFRSALEAVADALTAHGFAAHAEGGTGVEPGPAGTGRDRLRIVSQCCPYGGSASPILCAVDRGMVKGMLGALYGDTSPETTASRVLGDDRCVTAVGP